MSLLRAWYLLPPLAADGSVASQSAAQCQHHAQIFDLTRPGIATAAGEGVGCEQYGAVPLLVEYAKRWHLMPDARVQTAGCSPRRLYSTQFDRG